MKKDSLDMDDEDIAAIAEAIANCEQERILITHGTDTMSDTSRTLLAADLDKTIVLVGAWQPAKFINSDASFNIGFGLAAAMLLEPGVYVAMNGKILPAATVIKNQQTKQFE